MSEQQVPEILSKKTVKELTQDELEARIVTFLAARSMCVLSTCRNNVPRATPIEFRTKHLTLYMAGEPGIKLGNIKWNPRVSVGIYDPKSEAEHNWLDVEGMQLSGHARLIGKDEPDFLEAFRLFGHPEEWIKHWRGLIIEVVPDKIEFLCIALKLEEYASRQVWTRPGA
ncbi:MAG: pyridoxamine 5'-phosphate oxidase family protein [Chlorobiaceae bacterium]|nr:pyridoxamine 5'-phosphate oxidase family protein [Chlorobiaceae bacterium]